MSTMASQITRESTVNWTASTGYKKEISSPNITDPLWGESTDD